MSFLCYKRPGKLPDYFYPKILWVDLGDFKITDEYRADTAGLNDEESRMFTEILSRFCKDGSCPEDVANLGAKVNTLWSKYKLALYVDKLNKYVDTMEVGTRHRLFSSTFSIDLNFINLDLYIELDNEDDDPRFLYDELCKIKEDFLALKHFDYESGSYNYTVRFNCSNVEEYSRDALAELQRIRDFFVKNDAIFPDRYLLDEVIEQLETIIEYAGLIKNDEKRNDFLRTFDFDFFDTWRETAETIDKRADSHYLDDLGNPIVDINPGGDPKLDDD